ncbi:S1 RNA-binding domain-containing protein [Nocardia sp. 2]|uniref:S1 RNA-binding domain-containing protein n=1 Tax=Nocardia acididurans TaxID=2802282 RepID=A0ABS1M6A6_9NOCA|nr:S1 RNA-binding domain-containing protein [Nocardia acididurans]MBL1076168.1 S1 RNA-binding domain-containing protein [Nocardia acididurans]
MTHPGVPQESWNNFRTAHDIGATLQAPVAEVVPFGAFLEVAPGIHGLLHRNVWTDWNAEPEVGATLSVRIVAIDNEKHRVALALA